MIKSMTAYADGEIPAENLIILCELKSVNHRYTDIGVKLPDRLRFAEIDIRRSISEKLKRGKIECSISYKKQLNSQKIAINAEIVKNLLDATTEIEACMSNPRPFSAIEVLTFPGVQHENETDKEFLHKKIIILLDSTLDKLLEIRSREGAQLADILVERCQRINQLLQAANNRMPEVMSNLRAKLTARITELVAEPNFDRLEQELVLMAQKLDVTEELDRLETHVAEVLNTLKQPEPAGRRLDFLMQEMNREANTLGSKSADREMTQISINLKVLIEQMREQIQNIE